MAVDPVNVDDPVPQRLIKLDRRLRNLYRAVGGIVQYLDLELVRGIIQVAAGPNKPVDDKLLVKDGELQGDARKLSEVRLRLVHSILPVLVVAEDQLVAMDAVEGEDDHHQEVRNQECGVERIPVV